MTNDTQHPTTDATPGAGPVSETATSERFIVRDYNQGYGDLFIIGDTANTHGGTPHTEAVLTNRYDAEHLVRLLNSLVAPTAPPDPVTREKRREAAAAALDTTLHAMVGDDIFVPLDTVEWAADMVLAAADAALATPGAGSALGVAAPVAGDDLDAFGEWMMTVPSWERKSMRAWIAEYRAAIRARGDGAADEGVTGGK